MSRKRIVSLGLRGRRRGGSVGRSAAVCGAVVALLTFVAAPAAAALPDAMTIMKRIKETIEPAKPSIRTLLFTVHSAAFNETTQIEARQARKSFSDGARVLTVILAPESLRGTALLVFERAGEPDLQYIYFPSLHRVRKVGPVGADESFLGTDFSYADLGLVDLDARTFELLGNKELGDTSAYEVEERLQSPWHFTRIVNWVSAESMVPLQRDFYDSANVLWKVETFEDVPILNGVPTPVKIRMNDRESKEWTEIQVTGVNYDAKVSDDVFDLDHLPQASRHQQWSEPGR